jgi:hypothetical protein
MIALIVQGTDLGGLNPTRQGMAAWPGCSPIPLFQIVNPFGGMFGRLEILAQAHCATDTLIKRAAVAIIGIITNPEVNDPCLHPDAFILDNLKTHHPLWNFTFYDLSFHFMSSFILIYQISADVGKGHVKQTVVLISNCKADTTSVDKLLLIYNLLNLYFILEYGRNIDRKEMLFCGDQTD